MTYLNVTAKLNGSDVPTKKVLKALVSQNAPSLSFHPTSGFGDTTVRTIENLDKIVKYSVVGPNEYKRVWFATVSYSQSLKKWTVN